MKKIRQSWFLVALFCLSAAQIGYAQNRILDGNRLEYIPQMPFHTFYLSIQESAFSKENFSNQWIEFSESSSKHSLRWIRAEKDAMGYTREIFQHYYLDQKVENEYVLVHHKNGKIYLINGQWNATLDFENIPIIQTEIALASLERSQKDFIVKQVLENEQLITSVYIDGIWKWLPVRKLTIASHHQLLPTTFYIDENYRTIKSQQLIYDVAIPSVSKTYYKGLQPIIVDRVEDMYILKDETRNIYTYNGKWVEEVDYETQRLIPFEEYTNTTAEFLEDETATAAEVHWGMKWTYDYYKNVHQRNSYDDLGSEIINYNDISHEVFDGHGMNAAAMDLGSFAAMVYGDGRNGEGEEVMNPVVGVDVAGHEFTHLVVNRNGLGGLVYQGESGAINESIADVFGTSVEFYSGISPNWTIGEGIVKREPGFLRDMSNPNVRNMPHTYLGNYWFPTDSEEDYGGVHLNSSVGNYWFYVLVNGGIGVNDLEQTYQVHGIGMEAAQKIVYRALMRYLTPNSTYYDYYRATRQAALDLYGMDNLEIWNAVNEAWYAVGIGWKDALPQQILQADWSIYPNPTTEYVYVVSPNQSIRKIEVFDLSGKMIFTSDVASEETIIDLRSWSKGMYIIRATHESGIGNKKLIVK